MPRSRNEELLREAFAQALRYVGALRTDTTPSGPDLLRLWKRYREDSKHHPLFRGLDDGIAPPDVRIDDDIPF